MSATNHYSRMSMNLFRRKSITDLQKEALTDQSLKRALGPLNLTMLGIGAIIGTGIFVLAGQTGGAGAGPAGVVFLLLAGPPACFPSPPYYEGASLLPTSGRACTLVLSPA